MSKPKLALIPSGYKSGKVYSILPNDATGDFDYERNGNATRVRKDGLIEELTVDDTPRLDWYNSNCPSLLLEPQRTNYAIRNTSLHLNSTLTNSGTITKTGNYAIAPDGTMTATRLQASATGSGYALLNVNGVNPSIDGDGGGYYISTIYVKSNTGQEQTCAFYGASSGSPTTRTVTTEWTRIQFKGYRPSLTKYSYIGVALTNGSDDELDFLVWGGQTELVDSYASSLIITPSTSTVTRLKDECLNGGDSDLFDITEGTFFANVTPYDNEGANTTYILLSDGSTLNRIIFIFYGNLNEVRFFLSSNASGSTVNYLSHYQSISFNQKNKLALTFKKDELKCYANGSLVHTISSALVPINLESLDFSSSSQNASFFEGKVHDARVYDRVLTEAEAIELTTI